MCHPVPGTSIPHLSPVTLLWVSRFGRTRTEVRGTRMGRIISSISARSSHNRMTCACCDLVPICSMFPKNAGRPLALTAPNRVRRDPTASFLLVGDWEVAFLVCPSSRNFCERLTQADLRVAILFSECIGDLSRAGVRVQR